MARFNAGFYISQASDVLTNNLCKQGYLFVLAYFNSGEEVPLLMANLAITVYILPFLFFSYLAGKHAENRDKRSLVRKLKLLDLALLISVTVSYIMQDLIMGLFLIFLLGCKTAYMTPVKFSYISERYTGNELLRSNALMQSLSLSCMLIAITSAGILLDALDTPVNFGLFMIAISVFGLFGSYAMQTSRPKRSSETAGSVRQVIEQLAPHKLTPMLILIAWFWLISAMYMSQFINFVKLELAGTPSTAAVALTIFISGMFVCTFLLARFELRSRKLVCAFGAALSLLCAAVAFYESPQTASLTTAALFADAWQLSAILFVTGLFATAFISPLYAWLQQLSPGDMVARIMGLSSILNALFVCVSTLFAYLLLEMMRLSLSDYFSAIGIINLGFFSVFALASPSFFNARAPRTAPSKQTGT